MNTEDGNIVEVRTIDDFIVFLNEKKFPIENYMCATIINV